MNIRMSGLLYSISVCRTKKVVIGSKFFSKTSHFRRLVRIKFLFESLTENFHKPLVKMIKKIDTFFRNFRLLFSLVSDVFFVEFSSIFSYSPWYFFVHASKDSGFSLMFLVVIKLPVLWLSCWFLELVVGHCWFRAFHIKSFNVYLFVSSRVFHLTAFFLFISLIRFSVTLLIQYQFCSKTVIYAIACFYLIW